jgi:hypothetical protein
MWAAFGKPTGNQTEPPASCRELALAKRRGAEHTLIDFVGEIKDRYGITRTNARDKINIKLSDSMAVQPAKRPVEYDTGFTLLPDKYTIKFLAR